MKTGTLDILEFDSKVLKSNPLGDPTLRKIYVYLPKNISTGKKIPALLALVGFTGTGASLFNVDPFTEDLKMRMDRLIEEGKCPPAILVAPDCFNRFGGSQYINSSAIGNYEDYLIKEILPFIESKYPVSSWGVFGKSSGGYGSMVLGMKYPGIFSGLACHSGDAIFELSYIPDFKKALVSFQKAGGPKKWLEKFWNDVNRKRGEYHAALNTLAMAAHYSPNPNSKELGIDFPFCLETGVFNHDVWKRWKENDPVEIIDKSLANLKKLKAIFIDCGNRDEFGLQWGAKAMSKKMKQNGVEHVYEEFEDGHMSISYRYDRSIPFLVKALT